MNKITFTLASLLLAAGVFGADPPDAPPVPKTPAEIAFEKALAENMKPAEAAYAAYQKALVVANQKVLAALEATKKELNDPKKGKLTIQERAKALEELDAKIAEVKKGAVGEAVVAKATAASDLLGDKSNTPKGAAITLLCSSKWIHKGQFPYEFKKNMTFTMQNRGGTFEVSEDGSTFTVLWNGDKNTTEPGTIDGKTLTLSGSPLEQPKAKK